MNLTPQTVDAYKTLMTKPEENGLDFPSLENCFDHFDPGTPKHILYKEYVELIRKPLPKIIFYIVMDQIYFKGIVKCPDGNLGYQLKIKK